MANVQFFPINTPLINYFFYAAPLTQGGPNVPLSGGTLNFYADEDHSLQLPTYSDVSDPNNPVVNPNPIILGQAGDCPPFYLENRLYFIQIKDSSGSVVASIVHYDPTNNSGSVISATNGNLIANGQFSYPINFSQEFETPGLITDGVTAIAWAWEFLQDENTTTENTIIFNNIFNEGLEGNPINEVQLTSTGVDINESLKDARAYIGNVNFREGQDVTFSIQLQSKLSNSSIVNLILEKNYGEEGSPTELITLTNFTAISTYEKFIYTFQMPLNTGKIVDIGNYVAIRIRIGLAQITSVSMTNAQLLPGIIDAPVYQSQAFNDDISQIVGASIEIQEAGLPQNYSNYMYDDGEIFPYADTGTIVICPTTSIQPFRIAAGSDPLSVSGYNDWNIPYSRLYAIYGNTFTGGGGDLIVTSSGNQINFQSVGGAIEHSAYTVGTVTGWTVVNTQAGLKRGLSAAITSANTMTLTFVPSSFSPNQTTGTPIYAGISKPANGYIGNWFTANNYSNALTVANTGSSPAVSTLTFNSANVFDYQTSTVKSTVGGGSFTAGFLEYGIPANNSRGAYPNFIALIFFAIDGKFNNPTGVVASNSTEVIQLSSTFSLPQIMNQMATFINNPFIWTFTVNATPAASSWIGYSTSAADFYVWYKLDGVGTDPTPAGRTDGGPTGGIAISSSDSFITIAEKTAAAIGTATFGLPALADLPTIPNSNLTWFINL